MSGTGKRSPYFRGVEATRSEASLLLSETSEASDANTRSPAKIQAQRPGRQSTPLVYTEFRSPAGKQHAEHTEHHQTGTAHGADLETAVTKNSILTNLETFSSGTIWLVLLLPITVCFFTHALSSGWNLTSSQISVSSQQESRVHEVLGVDPARHAFVRPVLLLRSSNPVHVAMQAQLIDDNAPMFGYQLLHRHISSSDFIKRYVGLNGVANATTAKEIVIPLPKLYLDYPLLSKREGHREISVSMNVSRFVVTGPNRGGGVKNASEDQDNSGNETVNPSTTGRMLLEVDATIKGTTSSEDLLIAQWTTYSAPYITTVTVVQLLISLSAVVLLYATAKAVYTQACRLSDHFASLEGRMVSMRPTYGAIDSVEVVEHEAYTVRWWHFVLPEQFSVVFMLFFLSLWVGPVNSICGLVVDFGRTISEGWLFVAGLSSTMALFGLAFCCVVYVDGLKYHGDHIPGARWQHLARPRIRESTGSSRRSFDPFEMQDGRRLSAPADTDREYWRRESLGLRGYSSRLVAHPHEALTPLEKEYKVATSLFVTFHHPSSPEFLGFIHRKAIFLVVSWVVSLMYWLLMYPRLWHTRPLSEVQVENVSFRCWVVEILLDLIVMAWAIAVVQACIVTGARLRRMKLIESRFRQVAFRTLMLQVQLGFVLLVAVAAWYVYTEELLVGTHFRTIGAAVEYIAMWCAHYGVFRFDAVLAPPLAVHSAEVLVLVSTLVFCLAYSMVPPETKSPALSKRAAQAFVTLQRLLPDALPHTGAAQMTAPERERKITALRQYLVDEDYRRFMATYLPQALTAPPCLPFCLETALHHLEISYQTYFNLKNGQKADKGRCTPSPVPTQVSNGNHAPTSTSTSSKPVKPMPVKGARNNPFDEDVTDGLESGEAVSAAASRNPFDADEDAAESVPSQNGNADVKDEAAVNTDKEGESQYGPKINLAGLGYRLLKTFSCEERTTFGFLCESEATGELVVSFRGSLPGNAVSNLKFTQVALPILKRPRSYFTTLLRHGVVGDGGGLGGVGLAGSGSSEDGVLTPHSELIQEFDPQHTVHVDEFAGLYQRVESADDGYEEDGNYLPPAVEASTALKDSKLARGMRKVGTSIPLVNQGFKRVHAGFWESYASVREEFLTATVLAMYEQRKRKINAVQASSSVSPGNSWYSQPPVGQHTPAGSAVEEVLEGARSLFASPFSLKNPFSPMFSPAAEAPSSAPASGAGNLKAGQSPRTLVSADLPPAEDSRSLAVVFCGHSLGAAIASLAAYELAENMNAIVEAFAMEECFNVPKAQAVANIPAVLFCPAPQLSLYMYGSPRVGNVKFATSMEKKMKNIFRIQVNGDLVTMMPKFVGFYRHFGTAVIVDEEETGSIILEPTIIERSLLQKSTGSVANHSLDKYRACLEACFEPAELEEYLAKEFQGLTGGRRVSQELPEWISSRGDV